MECVLLIGAQATGKSTFYFGRFARTHMRINLDMLKTRHREWQFVEICLRTKMRFVVDNTNPTKANRHRYIEHAKKAGFAVRGFYFQSNTRDALQRNARRDKSQQVPDAGIRSTITQLELPSLAEGFQTLSYVSIGENGKFEVQDWSA